MGFGEAKNQGFNNPGLIVANKVIVFGPGDGVFVYNGSIGPGNLIASIASAPGFDIAGNAYLAGISSYFQYPSGGFIAAQFGSGGIRWFFAATEAGPWVASSSLILNLYGANAVAIPTFTGGMGFIGAAGQLTKAILPPSGDLTGSTDSTNFEALLTAGASTIGLLPGVYTFARAWLPVNGLIVSGSGYDNTQCQFVASAGINAGAAQTENVVIENLNLTIANGNANDLITGVNCVRWIIRDCKLIQNNAGNSIWNGSTIGTGHVMIECRFERNLEEVFGAVRTVEAWLLQSSTGANQISQNVWRDCVFFNEGNDTTQYYFHVLSTLNVNNGNQWENCQFEHPFGGMILLESHTRALLENVQAYDVPSGTATISNPLVQIRSFAGGLASQHNTLIGGVRTQSGVTFAAGVGDLNLDANAVQTVWLNPASSGDLTVYLGGSVSPKVINPGLPTSWLKDSAVTAVAGVAAGTGPPAPVVVTGPDNECGTITFGTGTGPAAGVMVNVTFGTPFVAPPLVLLTPGNVATALLDLFDTVVTATGFQIGLAVAPAASQPNNTYSVRWHAKYG